MWWLRCEVRVGMVCAVWEARLRSLTGPQESMPGQFAVIAWVHLYLTCGLATNLSCVGLRIFAATAHSKRVTFNINTRSLVPNSETLNICIRSSQALRLRPRATPWA
ncbi:hypothetical protein AK812_SmicGene49117 [Symbiodinium microadriaticum]|uniref:Uncharacterized protein n=1 Tax=Symbiodinium microadriaticum TaxID=2951 RepID=A0A1Q9EVF2_SYMMI|nr:hypothetical protein AK812_SmicGene49117 [Symbiodinium microadriaticum]